MPRRQRIDTANLELGMYVAQLDRPWLETPFLSQGFEIREDGELALLRKFCHYVYIDVMRGSLPPERLQRVLAPHSAARGTAVPGSAGSLAGVGRAGPGAGGMGRLLSTLARAGGLPSRLAYWRHRHNKVPVSREAPHAIRAYDAAVRTMDAIREAVEASAALDVGMLRAAAAPLVDSVLRNQDAMAWLVHLRKRNEYAGQHSVGCAAWAVILGQHLGMDRQGLTSLAMGGMLLDIGMSELPDRLTLRETPLSAAEARAIRKHVDIGISMLRLVPGIDADVLAMIGGHHERADGSGYPRGLEGNSIPVFARIAGLVDSYDSMISQRPWAAAKSPHDAMHELNALAGGKFQRELVEQFVRLMGVFPTGSVVELNTGEVGIVTEQNRVRRLRPKLLLVLDADKRPLKTGRPLDLGRIPGNQSLRKARWIMRGHPMDAFGLDSQDYFIG